MRLTVVDGFRGFFLLFMTVVHLNEVFNTTIGKLNHHYVGWVEDAQGFVFLSGLVVGIVYGRRLIRAGDGAMRKSVWTRIRTIYSHHAFLVLVFTGSAAVLAARDLHPTVFATYFESPILFPALSLGLLDGSRHMGILPMYIFFLAATPWTLHQLQRGRWTLVIVISVMLWTFAQLRIPDYFVGEVNSELAARGTYAGIGIFFNVFGWQLLYVTGLTLGFAWVSDRLDLSWLTSEEARQVAVLTVAAAVALAVFDRIVWDRLLGSAFTDLVLSETDRGNLSLIYVIAFATDLYLVTWMIRVGVNDESRLFRACSRLLSWGMTRPWLVRLGQHSLHVFTAHILLVYAASVLADGRDVPEWLGSLIILGGVGLMICVATVRGAWLERRAQSPA